jgi:hypothetical protein
MADRKFKTAGAARPGFIFADWQKPQKGERLGNWCVKSG